LPQTNLVSLLLGNREGHTGARKRDALYILTLILGAKQLKKQ